MGEIISDLAQWLLDALLWIPRWLWAEILDALASIVEAIEVPSWLEEWDSAVLSVTADLWWVAELFKVQQGLAIMVSALTIRFLIRRIPVIG